MVEPLEDLAEDVGFKGVFGAVVVVWNGDGYGGTGG